MQNLTPYWRKFLTQLTSYIVTLVVLAVLYRFARYTPVILALLWSVGLGGGAWLLFQLTRMWTEQDDLVISDERVHGYVQRALSYQAQIDRLVKTASPIDQPRLEQLRLQIDAWTKAVTELGQRLSSLRRDDLIRRDVKEVPRAITDLEARLSGETDAVVRSQLERALVNRRKQLEALEQLQVMLKRAEIQIESTVSQLGTIYSQLLTGQSTSHVADYSHLSADVDEEVRQLQDYLETLREVRLDS